jgi:hypothetical protein
MIKPSPSLLLALAALSVLALLVASDFAPESASTFSESSVGSGPIKVVCTVQSVKQGSNGWTMRLIDGQGGAIGAFLSNDSGPPPSVNSIIEATGNFNDLGDFFFVRSFEPIYSFYGRRSSG